MVSAVAPVGYSYYANAIASNTSASIPQSTYDQLLALEALQTEEDLFNIGDQNTTTDTATSGIASTDLLDLSPAALEVLNGIDNVTDTGIPVNTTVNNTLTGTTLTPTQIAQAASIVEQYANQPVTQQTFTEIQNALTAADINPEAISIQQLLNAYEYAYAPSLAFNGQLFTDTLASELTDA